MPIAVAVGATAGATRSRSALLLENALLRHQLLILDRAAKRPRLMAADRAHLVFLASRLRTCAHALVIVRPETVLRWPRQGFRLLWRRRSVRRTTTARIPAETVTLIRRLATENRRWGAERIRGELLKRGVRASKRRIQQHMRAARVPRPSGQTWGTFLRNHADAAWAGDFLPVTDLLFRQVYAFVVIALGSRRVVHIGVTRHPTDTWVAQQRREATPVGTAPRFLVRDNDGKYGRAFVSVAAASGSTELRTPGRAPRANATGERCLGSVRRACLDHLLIGSEAHLRRLLGAYVAYCNDARPHQGIGQALPGHPVTMGRQHAGAGRIVAFPIVGGLHHDYRRAA